jgi:hypothetical protein
MKGDAKRSVEKGVDRKKFAAKLKKSAKNVNVEKLRKKLRKKNTKSKSVVKKK